jgi:hypothetical protein
MDRDTKNEMNKQLDDGITAAGCLMQKMIDSKCIDLQATYINRTVLSLINLGFHRSEAITLAVAAISGGKK